MKGQKTQIRLVFFVVITAIGLLFACSKKEELGPTSKEEPESTSLACKKDHSQCGSCDIRDASGKLLMCQQCRLKSDGTVGLCATGCGNKEIPLTANTIKGDPYNISAAATSSFNLGKSCPIASPAPFGRCSNAGAIFTVSKNEILRIDNYYYEYVKNKGSIGSQYEDAQADCKKELSYIAIYPVTTIPGTYEDLR